jgi:hypothetical protein
MLWADACERRLDDILFWGIDDIYWNRPADEHQAFWGQSFIEQARNRIS